MMAINPFHKREVRTSNELEQAVRDNRERIKKLLDEVRARRRNDKENTGVPTPSPSPEQDDQ